MVGPPSRPGRWPKVRDAVDASQGWGPTNGMDSRSIGTFNQKSVSIGGNDVSDVSDALVRAYKILHPDNTREDRKEFAALFAANPRDIFDRKKLNPRWLMGLIGDGSGRSFGFGGKGESALKTMLLVLTNPQALPAGHPLRNRLEMGESDPNKEPVRLNAVADEPEQSLEYLELVKALAAELGVDVRIIAVPTDKGADFDANPVGNLIFIDLDDIVINPDNTVDLSYEQAGTPQTEQVNMTGGGSPASPSRYAHATLRLNRVQRITGETE
jgi:hypothetical protein